MKDGPCGDGPHVRGTDVATFEPGQTITVKWHETIGHQSTYRISFDDDGDDSFEDPETTTDYYTNETVLLDEIADVPGNGEYAVEVTLPDIECDNCTLQVIQLMLDKPPYVPGTNDIYYQCADVALIATEEPPEPDGDDEVDADGGDGEQDAACGCAVSSPASWGWIAAVGMLAARRRSVRAPLRAPAGSRTDRLR
jgi:hypothetical protein